MSNQAFAKIADQNKGVVGIYYRQVCAQFVKCMSQLDCSL